MKTSTKYTQHTSEGHELELPCGKCCAKTFHHVVCPAAPIDLTSGIGMEIARFFAVNPLFEYFKCRNNQ